MAVIILWLSVGYGRTFFAEATAQNVEKTWILCDALSGRGTYFDSHLTILNGSLGIKPHDYSVLEFEGHLKTITPAKSIERGVHWWEEF